MARSRREKEDEEFARQERLAYVGALAAGLVHEVRTPLHAIQLNAQMLAEDVDRLRPEMQKRFSRRSQRIYEEVKGLSRTLDAFLTFARPPRLEPTPLDLNHFVRDLIEFVKPEMDEAAVEIEALLAPDMYPVTLDQNQFTHVLLNLFRNAQESIQQRREKEGKAVPGLITVTTREADSVIILEFADNGIGLEPEHESQIFDVFFTTKEKGTGLGLGIVRRIIEDHRGTIELISTVPPGAIFEITLPRGRFLELREDEPERPMSQEPSDSPDSS